MEWRRIDNQEPYFFENLLDTRTSQDESRIEDKHPLKGQCKI